MDTNTQPIQIPRNLTISESTLASYLQDNFEKYLKVYLSKSEFSESRIVEINYGVDYLEIKIVLKGKQFIETRAYLYLIQYNIFNFGLEWINGEPRRSNITKWWKDYDGVCGTANYKDYILKDKSLVHAPDYTKANETYVIRTLYSVHLMLKEILRRYDSDHSFKIACYNTTITNSNGHSEQLIADARFNLNHFYERMTDLKIEFEDNWW